MKERAGRVVGRDHYDGLTTLVDRACDAVEIDAPALVVLEKISAAFDRFEHGEVLEQRIAGPWNEHVMTWIAEQLEQPCVGLTGTSGEGYPIRLNGDAAVGEVAGNGFTRLPHSEWMRIVAKRLRRAEWAQHLG